MKNLAMSSKLTLSVFLLGNFYGLGRVREKELMKSCKILGIPKENVVVLNNR